MMPPEEVAIIIDRAEQYAMAEPGSPLSRVSREVRRRMIAKYVFERLRGRAAGAAR